ncbi:MAG: vitamin B12-dependent ribonucleotide reductase [Candidatus Cloacimonetes bacterium]|nr:vitamin B12-dependent ribonucleotide reductase [Candidatus Cloacimonadota bacterium]
MKLTDNALTVLKKRYFRKDDHGKIVEDWDSLVRRVAGNIAAGDTAKEQRYARLIDSGAFLPNSPTLMNAGGDLQQLSACFVLPVEDSMDSIFSSIHNAALIHKSGGGTGFSFSRLREANARVRSTNGVSSGPLSFLRVFNAATDAVKQGGTRRGANMAILSVEHPDIIEFITAKDDLTQLTNFNLSVGITEQFMQAVNRDEEYNLVSPHNGEVKKRIKARDVFALIVEMAHKNGEPGIVFLDRINKFNPTPHIGEIESTNPCGEQPLLPNEACNLGSLNLAAFWNGDAIDWDSLRDTVREAVDFLDDVIDRSRFPLPEIDEMVKANRKIGLGVMGWADLLFLAHIPYDSEEGIELAADMMEFIDYHAKMRSVELAKVKGPFPNYRGSTYDRGDLMRKARKMDWDALRAGIAAHGIRNATLTTIAPTGTISMICNTASGVEPQFSLVFHKNVLDGESLLYVNPVFEATLRESGLYTDELMKEVSAAGGAHNVSTIPDSLRRVFVTSHDISPEWHIRMQAAFQDYTDNAVSKTINFGREATREEVHMAFELAYTLGCKGLTVYRDGSRDNQVLSAGASTHKKEAVRHDRIAPRERPEITRGFTQRVETGCGHMYVTINTDEQGAFELFTQMGKVGGCASAQLEAIARLVSLCLRSNVQVESIVRQLKGIRCPSPMWFKGKIITSCSDGVGTALATVLKMDRDQLTIDFDDDKENRPAPSLGQIKMSKTCPDCGSAVEFAEGCMKCSFCGWSKC